MIIRKKSYKRFLLFRAIVFIFILSSLLLCISCPKTKKVYKIGILDGLNFFSPSINTFKEKMSELGYIEGENVVYEIKSSNIDMAKFEQFAKEFIENKVDLIYVFPTDASVVVKNVTKDTDIPIVFNGAMIEGIGLVDTIQNPGGNITGIRFPGPDIVAKNFEFLMQIDPNIKTVFVPHFKGYPSFPSQLEALKPLADSMKVKIIDASIESPPELAASLKKYAKSIDAILTVPDPVAAVPDFFKMYAKFAVDNKIILGATPIQYEGYGALFSVNMNVPKSGTQAAVIVDKILNGTKAGTIPVVSAYDYIKIDYKRATEQGFIIPDSIIKQADEVIK
jgi:putative ABC transport system substrate-binding protein